MTNPIGITLGFEGVQKFQADGRTAVATVDNIGVSAKQTAAALRGVPAQFTDIITSLQGGQAPLTVFLQQGGQLKDMFGGAGNAAKALGGYVVGLINPFTAAAAAGVALAVAYKQGSAEADAYAKSIALTGNAAGTTSAQLQDMASRVSGVVATQGKAAEVLAQMVGTGRVGRDNLEQFTATAIRMERTVGVAVKDTVKEFAELGKAPLEASKQLNERYNYLTAAVYEQITALKEQGKTQEAATLAQKTYDEAMSKVSITVEGRLGSLERAWLSVSDAAKKGWDSMLNVGRAPTAISQLADVQKQISARENQLANEGFVVGEGGAAFGRPSSSAAARLRAELSSLQGQSAALQGVANQQKMSAEEEAERVRIQRAGVAAVDALTKAQDKGLTKQQQMNAALKEYGKQLDDLRAANKLKNDQSDLLTPEAIARGEKAIREQFKETGSGAASGGENTIARLKARADAAEKYLEQLRATGKEAEKLLASEIEANAIREQLDGSVTGRARREKELMLVQADRIAVAERAAVTDKARLKSIEESEASYRKYLDSITKTGDAYGNMADQQEAANASFGRSKTAIEEVALAQSKFYAASEKDAGPWDPEKIAAMERAVVLQERYVASLVAADGKTLNARADELLRAAQEMSRLYEDEAQLAGLTGVERAKITALRQVELKYAKELADIDKTTATTDEAIAAKQAARDKTMQAKRIEGEAAVAKAVQDDWTRTTDEINRSLTDALLRGFESGKGFAQNLRDTVKNMFSTLVLRPVISAIINPVASLVTSALGIGGGSGGGGVAGTAGSIVSGANFFNSLSSGSGFLGSIGSSLGLGGSGALGAGGSAIMGALGPIALGLGAIALLANSFKGETRTGGQFGVAFDGQVTNQRRGQTYTYQGQQYDRDFSNGERRALIDGQAYRLEGDPVAQESLIRDAVSGTAKGINAFLEALGSTARLSGFSAGLETSGKGRGGVFAGGTFEDGRAFGESGKGDNYEGTLYEKFSTNSPDFKQALADFTLDLKQSTIQALQTVSDIPESIKKMLKDVDAEGLSEEAANALLESINAQIVGVKQLKDAFSAMGMERLADMTFDVAAGLAEVSGGFDKLQGNLSTYYSNFYSAEEQRANMERQVARQLRTVGIDIPDINSTNARAQYRALVERAEQDMSEEGRKTYATLLALSGAFAELTQSTNDTTEAIERQRKASQDAAYDLYRRASTRDREALNAQASTLQASISSIRGSVDMLRSNARDLLGGVDPVAQMMAGQGRAYINTALAGVRSGASVDDYTGLSDAIAAARAGIDGTTYRNQTERDYAAQVLAGPLNELGALGETQLTFEERQLKLVQTELDRLTSLDKRAAELVDGTTALTETVDTYFQRLIGILAPADVGTNKPLNMGSSSGSGGAVWGGTSGASGGGSGGGKAPASPYGRPVSLGTAGTAYVPITDPAEIARLDKYAGGYHAFDGTNNGEGLAAWIRQNGLTPEDMSGLSGHFSSSWEDWYREYGIPGFANGGMHSGGLRVVGERGWEIEATGPARYWNQQQLAGAMGVAGAAGDPALREEVRALRQEVAALRASNEQAAAAVVATHDLLARVTLNGNGMVVTDAPL